MKKEGLTDGRARMLFWILLIAAAAVRCAGFVDVPGGVNQDEAMAGVDAWALSQYGTDRYGTFLPVHFTAWRYGQMSVLLSYCMIPFIRIFGFCTLAVRFPMLLAGCGSVALVYLVGKRLFSKQFGLLAMAMTAINPWHFMQSRWSLDCNLFPHVFLLAFFLMLLGLEKKRWLYLSMIFFGLTFYCYGVAAYAVPLFLSGYAVWCLKQRRLRPGEILICALIFVLTALPEIAVLAINFFGWPSVKTPFFTLSYFPENIRNKDILFLNFSVEQLFKNLGALINTAFLQKPDAIYNALPDFGPMYYISIPFMLIGIVTFRREMAREKDRETKARWTALWYFFLMGIWVGITTYQVNVNRINIIFFPLIFLCCRGICAAAKEVKNLKYVTAAAYAVCFILFLTCYFTEFADRILLLFHADFLTAVKEADEMEGYDRLYITSDAGWQTNWQMTEILTQYACRIDAEYYQEKTRITGGRELLPYSERYHFIDMGSVDRPDLEGLYVVYQGELDSLPFMYEVLCAEGTYFLIRGEECGDEH